MLRETHPYITNHFDNTKQWKYLIIGTFPPRRGCKERTDLFPFFYGNKGSLWEIIKETGLYPGYNFDKIDEIKSWQDQYSIGITDVLVSCKRQLGKECSPADKYLIIDEKIDLNIELKNYVLNNLQHIEKIYFTSGSDEKNSNSAYCLFLKLMGSQISYIKNEQIVKLPSPSGEFLRTVFTKEKKNFGLKQYFYDFLKENHFEALAVAEKTYQDKLNSPKKRINRNGKIVPVTTERFPNSPNYPSLYRIAMYKSLLPIGK